MRRSSQSPSALLNRTSRSSAVTVRATAGLWQRGQPTDVEAARRCLLPSMRDQKHADREAVEVVTVVGDVGRPWLSVAALR
jgi:hypothetical protein